MRLRDFVGKWAPLGVMVAAPLSRKGMDEQMKREE
jgi:hypothetical protein